MKLKLAVFFIVSIAFYGCYHWFRLPAEWDGDFTISANYGGSMDGSFSNLLITYDSCHYEYSSPFEKIEVKNSFRMNEELRKMVLRKMKELEINDVHPRTGSVQVHDAPSISICFALNCIPGGESVEMSEHDAKTFEMAYKFLEDFAKKKERTTRQ